MALEYALYGFYAGLPGHTGVTKGYNSDDCENSGEFKIAMFDIQNAELHALKTGLVKFLPIIYANMCASHFAGDGSNTATLFRRNYFRKINTTRLNFVKKGLAICTVYSV